MYFQKVAYQSLYTSGSKNHESVSVTDLACFMIRRLRESKCRSSIKSFLDIVCCDVITRLKY